jgi:hypothetical protein
MDDETIADFLSLTRLSFFCMLLVALSSGERALPGPQPFPVEAGVSRFAASVSGLGFP